MKKKTEQVEMDLNSVDRIRKEVKNIDKLEYKLYYLMMTDRLSLMNTLANDKEKLEWLEETNAVFEELVYELLNKYERK